MTLIQICSLTSETARFSLVYLALTQMNYLCYRNFNQYTELGSLRLTYIEHSKQARLLCFILIMPENVCMQLKEGKIAVYAYMQASCYYVWLTSVI